MATIEQWYHFRAGGIRPREGDQSDLWPERHRKAEEWWPPRSPSTPLGSQPSGEGI